ncbi:hypothetical protein NUW54_g2681 [Trametes sanguinea]|uniref:Uncharacterized protein n=1 Tax=Trametes sanguinea TaxID=158606 RepID=A0ACC1Q6L9_9APHY|nr:hypothetical protein NUW54_g2681 [Trametes sanguinea]
MVRLSSQDTKAALTNYRAIMVPDPSQRTSHVSSEETADASKPMGIASGVSTAAKVDEEDRAEQEHLPLLPTLARTNVSTELPRKYSDSRMQFFSTLAAFIALATSTMATPASLTPKVDSSLIERAAQYSDHCGANPKCTGSLRSNCNVALALIDPDTIEFSSLRMPLWLLIGTASTVIYDTGGAGQNPVSGQTIINTAKAILQECGQTCGSYGTNNDGCTTCHVTIDYRA